MAFSTGECLYYIDYHDPESLHRCHKFVGGTCSPYDSARLDALAITDRIRADSDAGIFQLATTVKDNL